MRAISTVVDVTLCLLLVSAGVVALTLPASQPPPDRDVDEVASVLGTTSTSVSYQLSPDRLSPSEADTIEDPLYTERHRHGTVAGLLARAAISDARVDGTQLAPEASDYRDTVREEAQNVLPASMSVTARWEPYPGAAISGVVSAGESPPETANVQTATLAIPVTAFAVNTTLEGADSYEAVARPVARAIVDGTLPAEYGTAATSDELAVRSVAHRAVVLSGNESLPAAQYLFAGDVSGLRDRVTEELTARLEADLRAQFESSEAAAEAVSPGVVTVTVRGWTGDGS